jgi:hypothetical protein
MMALHRSSGGRGRFSRRRRGSLLAEVAMSAVLLMIAMALTTKVLGWVAMERRAWDRRQWAAQEAANLMERVTSQPYDSVSAPSAEAIGLSAQARQLLPEAELKVEVGEDEPAGGKGSKRVAIRLRWRNRAGEWDAPVRLVSWIYRGRAGR